MYEPVTETMCSCETAADCNAAIERSRVARNYAVVFHEHRGVIFIQHPPRTYLETQRRQFYAEPQHVHGPPTCTGCGSCRSRGWRERRNGTQTFRAPQRQLFAQIAARHVGGAVSEFERQPFDRPTAAALQNFDASIDRLPVRAATGCAVRPSIDAEPRQYRTKQNRQRFAASRRQLESPHVFGGELRLIEPGERRAASAGFDGSARATTTHLRAFSDAPAALCRCRCRFRPSRGVGDMRRIDPRLIQRCS